jgi:uncharacterized membrane-anchored protein
MNIRLSHRQKLSSARKALLVFGAAALLIGFNHAVYTKTQTLEHGSVVKLKLAPRDPRGLLTGDYMTLNYDISNALRQSSSDKHAEDGYVLVNINAQGVGEFVSQSANYPALGLQQLAMQYRIREKETKFATNAFYFQEGQGKAFEAARYGEFRVNAKGELLLTHLLDENLVRIDSKPNQTIN